ncbi:MAG: triose-phosphate isomerase [Tabrizicola sp.]|uniref:triose-phosphate isomerase n=1 Tax=Tabrizicola sp. TaxID=2005166 RepID=UPI002737379D|nr:triose-phosphate isomerase [Tabrizicola sp.]MDP3262994.1 triose-phosphate isomerase [Tabrizicola sp.]MDP3649337.1 triose-phosphate isomerase [Paracoccaceae bacterium]MDZ4068167.1 triose-phosphate isomerase [Tabrizicola sp.]
MQKLAAGNWKMNGTAAALAEVTALIAAHPAPKCEMLLCPPATLVAQMAWAAKGSALRVGGQDCHPAASGAHTGDISAAMLKDAGASHVIVGHSERRTDHGETDALVKAKAAAAIAADLVAIVCIGETETERDAGRTLDVIGSQLDGSLPKGATAATTVIAYEPVWAIGTGRTPTLAEIAEVHAFIRARLATRIGAEAAGVRLLYGGSVKPSNADEIFAVPNVDGALVGGASLKAADFGAIVAALAS